MITHLFNESRAAFGIMQGLLDLFDVVETNIDYESNGKLITKKSEDIFYAMKNSDFILMNDCVFYSDFLQKENLWKKVIFYDYRDNTNLIESVPLSTPYFKRSLFDSKRNKIVNKREVFPIAHCALKEYFIEPPLEKKHDIGCFFDERNKNLGIRRTQILEILKSHSFENSLIGVSTAFANEARLAIKKKPEDNSFYEFIKMQNSCKIIATAQPEKVDGDNRTWEALASGALVFCEQPMIPMNHPLVDGKHCIFFDSFDSNSLQNVLRQMKHYLKNEQERFNITASARSFVEKYHMPINRVRQMLNRINAI
jgi:hypothetical protein